MAFYRIFAVIKKDLIWIKGNKKMLMYILPSFLFFFIAIIFSNSLFSILGDNEFLTKEDSRMWLAHLKVMLLLFALISVGILWVSELFLQEKNRGTFLALLTSPLKYQEFILAKLLFSGAVISFFPICSLFLDLLLNRNESLAYILGGISFSVFIFNLALFLGFILLIGIILGLALDTNLEHQKIAGSISMLFMISFLFPIYSKFSPNLQKLNFFSPFFHLNSSYQTKKWTEILIHTGFNSLFLASFLIFSYFYIKFYFSKGREKRFSLKFSAGLVSIAGLYFLSGLTSMFLLNKDYENIALYELKQQAIKRNKLFINKWEVPLEDFFKNSIISKFQLSPNGKYLAYLKPYEKRMNLYFRPLDESQTEKRITSQTKRDISAFAWKGNDTLIFLKDFKGDENFHVFRTSIKEENEKDLTPFQKTKVQIIDFLEDISKDHILIGANKRNKAIFDVYRLNIRTGDMQLIAENPGSFIGWKTDHDGKLRIAVSSKGLKSSIYYREKEEDDFEKIMTTDFTDSFIPLLFTFDNKNLYVASNLKKDKVSFEVFDPRKKKFISTLFFHPEVDISSLTYSKKRKTLTSAVYTTWKTKFHFFDIKTEKLFKYLKSQLPNKELSVISTNKDEDIMIVLASSDRSPGLYYLYDKKKDLLKLIANPRPWIKEDKMVENKAIKYKSRDGLTIQGYLSLPKTKSGRKLPLVVNPHGGPWTRNVWGYNPEVQFLANRGYAVFQMNFRGSTGYGKNFWKAGFKQWGKRMQDDITDGVKYLIEEDIVDKNKIAIYGASYGGYAVLAGLAFTPDLYACGVNVVGVSNLFTWLNSIPAYWESHRQILYELVGHPEKDKDLLTEISPFFHVDNIRVPLFVVQGAKDPRVKREESDQIVKALEKRGLKVPYLVKANEGHGFQNEENRIEFYKLMETFLADCLNYR